MRSASCFLLLGLWLVLVHFLFKHQNHILLFIYLHDNTCIFLFSFLINFKYNLHTIKLVHCKEFWFWSFISGPSILLEVWIIGNKNGFDLWRIVCQTLCFLYVFAPLVFPVTLWCYYYIHLEVRQNPLHNLQGSIQNKNVDFFFKND